MKDRPAPCFFFGKLSAHADFVRYNASGDDVRAMESWIEEGLYRADRHFGSRWASVYRSAVPHFFLFDPENGDSVLIGILKPSRDRSGRRYPFVLARRIEAALAKESPPFVLPVMFGPALSELESLAVDASDTLPLPEISARLERTAGPVAPASVRDDFESFVRSTTVEAFWNSIRPEASLPARRSLERRVLRLARFIRAAGSVPRTQGMRFPLSRRPAGRLKEVGFWTKCVLAARGHPGVFPSIFWPASAEDPAPRLFVYLARPSPRAFLSLMDPDADPDTIFWTDGKDEEEAAGGSDRDGPPGEGTPRRPAEPTLDEFLDRL